MIDIAQVNYFSIFVIQVQIHIYDDTQHKSNKDVNSGYTMQ